MNFKISAIKKCISLIFIIMVTILSHACFAEAPSDNSNLLISKARQSYETAKGRYFQALGNQEGQNKQALENLKALMDSASKKYHALVSEYESIAPDQIFEADESSETMNSESPKTRAMTEKGLSITEKIKNKIGDLKNGIQDIKDKGIRDVYNIKNNALKKLEDFTGIAKDSHEIKKTAYNGFHKKEGLQAWLDKGQKESDIITACEGLSEEDDFESLKTAAQHLAENTSDQDVLAFSGECTQLADAGMTAKGTDEKARALKNDYTSVFRYFNPSYYVKKIKYELSDKKKARKQARAAFKSIRQGYLASKADLFRGSPASAKSSGMRGSRSSSLASIKDFLHVDTSAFSPLLRAREKMAFTARKILLNTSDENVNVSRPGKSVSDSEIALLEDLDLFDIADKDLDFSIKGIPTQQDEFIMWVIPSPRGQDWSTPKKLLFSSIPNQVSFRHFKDNHAIGHVFVEIRSHLLDEPVFTGMTTVNSTQETELVTKHGYLLSVLFADLNGKLDDPEKLKKSIKGREESGYINYIRYLINPAMSKRIVNFFKEYQNRKCHEHYGGPHRPRYSEGGGCSGFGMGFVSVMGLVKDEYIEKWQRHLDIPERLLGGPITGNRLKPWVILGKAGSSWAKPGEKSKKLMMWEPDLMSEWIKKTWSKEYANPGSTGYMLEKRKKARGLVVDAMNVTVPEEDPFIYDGPDKSYIVPVLDY